MHSSSSLRWKIGCINTWLESSVSDRHGHFLGCNWRLLGPWGIGFTGCCFLDLLSLVCVGVLNGQDPIHALYRARLAPAACRTWNDFMDFMDFMWKLLQWIPMIQVVKRFVPVPPKLSNSWLLPPPQQQTYFHQTNTPGKQKWVRSVAHLDGQCHFIQAAETRRYRFKFQGWLLRRCYFAIDRGFTNAKWLLRLYQRTIEGSDRAFLVTPWKGGVGGLDMFFHPPLDHYKLWIILKWYKLALLTGMDRFWSSWWSHSVVRWPLLKPLRDYSITRWAMK